ncbi:toxin-antitoxin system YwqK family antitoxin [Hymenobacter sp. APR13]|uniref:toxin-antitoxin system YwqK family antitoxin n=1 Tax=Hymenobacter sp. APR13 TaxID=1356852 RepID=UPI0004E04E26|nr:hypothetical protein [Hymenobacter sp. APR13]AII51930.1 hypothetical protein N008_08055 [Hymenobacter sp. APR13]
MLKAKGPVGFWSDHRYDRDLRPHGPWRTYYPASVRQVAGRERYRHGRLVGTSRFYGANGVLERKEVYVRAAAGLMRITYYHPNGRIWRTGQARIVAEPDGSHFYWFGDWPVYSAAGKAEKLEHYEAGKLVSVRPAAAPPTLRPK